MTRRPSSIRRKLVAGMMLTSTTALVLTGATLVVWDSVSVRRTLVQTLATRAEMLAANSTAALAFQNSDDATQVLAALGADPHMEAAALYDEAGRLFATYPSGEDARLMSPTEVGIGHRFEDDHLVLARPVIEGGRMLGTLCLQSDLRALTDRMRLCALIVVLAIAGSIGVAFALASWLQRGLTAPVQVLAELAGQVSNEKDYSLRAPVTSDDELGMLTETFNAMLHQIERRDGAIRQLNAQLERRVAARTAELEATNHELEAFSYSVSHDLRAPLRHVDGFADLLQRHSAPALDDTGRHYLANISKSAKSMGVLIDDLLAFSRMGRSELREAAVRLADLTGEVRAEVERDAGGRPIEWVVGELPEIHADPAMLRQVLTNLLSNAVKYTRDRERARIEVGARTSDNETVVFVRDNGVGFDPAYSHKLFGVFQRLHSSDDFEGTGIGLANVRRIIQRHGGRTWAEGKVGAGATFYFSLPSHEAVGQQIKEAA